ncbi:Rhomboid-like protein [Trichormus variabilis ATCC 29413]|uniref:Rhomboid-like protein n=2 Tax=Anabaena variabilis TaxID=264691 RepID=Q3MCW2_TRIV2|nr:MULTISPECIES: rhomboid family intramembrane serine protease [Nostocaceae]ABA21174.1 Rhomboid-like protein [Trichormus variabilis ATCC 29413]MBC1213790.1 rhomboid family intramembrane serine protease [Trichormus variabilis ARAD]MBC1258047.1 rhomboid family intramembrane serine protease [Trichormus variabilis V5]MBC1266963.1 rhomboid family intramembrane serine protease [Trichormus variabilis FSR]MBC1301487.1 rhomboid family intramembrane serine protease [Trichormus variabilis N2B]
MIPISDNLHFRERPIINYWLIGINIVIFLWEIKLELSGELGAFINTWGLVPSQISTAVNHALINPAALVVVFGRLFSLLFAIFLHGSFSQILGNILFLWVFGKAVENILGHQRYLGFYLVAGVVTGLAQIIIEPNLTVPLIGANGAIAAVLGAYIIKFPQVKIDTVLPLIIIYIPIELPASFYSLWWYIQQLFYGIGSLNIPPTGVNQPSLAYWMQLVAMTIGAVYVRKKF